MDINPVQVTQLPLPFYEDFKKAGSDAFDGKCFVRFPPRAPEGHHVHGPAMRLRCQQPPFESMWLPHHCIVDDNVLARVRMERRASARASRLGSVPLAGTSVRAANTR